MTIELDAHKKFLLAVSGGVDSMVMCDLFLKKKYSFAVAHCNFQLRSNESDGDELLVKNWCGKNNIPFHAKKFETASYADENKLSIQVAARQLRYQFFNQLLCDEKYDMLATAHHLNDNIETMLFHFFRGTGIQGLTGIPQQSEKLIRPLLHVSKQEIIAYATENNIDYRNDSSNLKSDYTRNNLRNNIIPQLEALFPGFKNNITHNIQRLSEANELYTQQIETYRKKLIEQRGKDFYIPILKLKNATPLSTILYELLKPFQFSYEQSRQVYHMISSESGRKVENEKYFVLKNRNFFIISEKNTVASEMIVIDNNATAIATEDFELRIKTISQEHFHLQKEANFCQIDIKALCFPLLLRKWRMGDYMYPLGMKKKKKISRILIDLKIPVHEKEHVWVIESEKKIVWLVGHKTDERFKITDHTKNIFVINQIKN